MLNKKIELLTENEIKSISGGNQVANTKKDKKITIEVIPAQTHAPTCNCICEKTICSPCAPCTPCAPPKEKYFTIRNFIDFLERNTDSSAEIHIIAGSHIITNGTKIEI